MTLLQRKLIREDKKVKRRGYYLYLLHQREIGKIFQSYADKALQIIPMALMAITEKENGFNQLHSTRVTNTLRDNLDHLFQHAASEMEQYWSKNRTSFDLYARVSASYLDRKVSPPWVKSKIDLSSKLSTDDERDPRKGHFKYFMSLMVNNIISQIQRGALNEETPNQIFSRVKALFNRKTLKGVREVAQYRTNLSSDLVSYDDQSMALYGPIEIDPGFYSQDNLSRLNADMISANDLEFRQYRPWFTDELLKNNKALYRLEQQMYSDYVNLFNSGLAEAVPDLKGIDDLEWSVQRPGECDCCDARDGLTMAEIKEKIDDDYGDKVPSLHPNCRCELIPRTRKLWKEADLEKQGVEWDQETGQLKIPKEVRDKYRLDLSLDEYINYISQGGGK